MISCIKDEVVGMTWWIYKTLYVCVEFYSTEMENTEKKSCMQNILMITRVYITTTFKSPWLLSTCTKNP